MMVVMFLGRVLCGGRTGHKRKRSGTQQDCLELHVLSPRNAIENAAWDAASSPRTLEKLGWWYWRGTSATRRFRDGFTTVAGLLQTRIAARFRAGRARFWRWCD